MEKFIRFLKEEDGLETVEYALIAALLALAAAAGIAILATAVNDTFQDVGDNLSSAS